MGHIEASSYSLASTKFSQYRSILLNDMNTYAKLSNKESLTDAEQEFMRNVEARYQEAKGLGYFE